MQSIGMPAECARAPLPRRCLGFDLRHVASAVTMLAVSMVVALLAGNGFALPTINPIHAASSNSAFSSDRVCASTTLRLGDLPFADAPLQASIDELQVRATTWFADAALVALTPTCEPGSLLFNATFATRTPDGMTYWQSSSTDAGSKPPRAVAPFDPAAVSFAQLHAWLAAAGLHDDQLVLGHLSATTDPYGKGARDGHLSYLLTYIDTDGSHVEVIVDGVDGSIATRRFDRGAFSHES